MDDALLNCKDCGDCLHRAGRPEGMAGHRLRAVRRHFPCEILEHQVDGLALGEVPQRGRSGMAVDQVDLVGVQVRHVKGILHRLRGAA